MPQPAPPAPPPPPATATAPTPEIAAELARALQEAASELAGTAQAAQGAGASVSSIGTPGVGNLVVIKGADGSQLLLQNVDPAALAALAEKAPRDYDGPSPRELVGMLVGFGLGFALLYPLVRALASRLARPTPAPPTPSAIDDQRLARIEAAVEAVSLEVERISEGQRFTTRLLSERSSVAPAPLFQPAAAERVAVPRQP
jgi:hypothetical protein